MKKLLIKNISHLVTIDNKRTILKDHDVLIEDNKIAKIGQNIKDSEAEIISGSGKVCLPGFINTHHHFYQVLTRVMPKVQSEILFNWLINSYEVWRELTEEAVEISTKAAVSELLLTGCTTAVDHFYVFPKKASSELLDIEIETGRELGIRFNPLRGSMSRGKSKGGLPPDDVVQTEDEILKDYDRLIEKYHDPKEFSMMRVSLGPCSPFSVTEELMRETIKYARKNSLRCHTHLAETLDEEKYCLEEHKMRPLELMESLGWLGEDVWFAHGVHFNDEEISKLAKTKTGIAHCPTSNLRLGSGIARIPEMLDAGVPVGLAVDGSGSNDSSNMLAELKLALLVHRIKRTPKDMTPIRVYEMATLGGAKLLGRNDIGSIEVGKAADIVLFKVNDISFAGTIHDPVGALLMCGISDRADTTIVNGKVLVEGGHLVHIDEYEVFEKANKVARQMYEKADK